MFAYIYATYKLCRSCFYGEQSNDDEIETQSGREITRTCIKWFILHQNNTCDINFYYGCMHFYSNMKVLTAASMCHPLHARYTGTCPPLLLHCSCKTRQNDCVYTYASARNDVCVRLCVLEQWVKAREIDKERRASANDRSTHENTHTYYCTHIYTTYQGRMLLKHLGWIIPSKINASTKNCQREQKSRREAP